MEVTWKFWLYTVLLLWNSRQPGMAEQHLGSPSYIYELIYLWIT